MSDFVAELSAAYATDQPAIDLGRGVHEGTTHGEVAVRLPMRTVNRHGLIAGATGTGKTISLQLLAEQLSAAGVPCLVADLKGDLSGVSEPGAAEGPAPKRMTELGLPFAPVGAPTEFLSIGGLGPGVPIRATVSDFGPQLLGKVLGSNETQEQSLQLVFHYADQRGLPLLDLSDLRALLTFLDSDAGKSELDGIGGLSTQTVGVLLRSLIGLETGGGNEFFGESMLDIHDLLRVTPEGKGVVSCLELAAVQDKPELFSTVLMWIVAELFETLPEVGDLDQPKFVVFLDEAHLLFKDATPAFKEAIVRTVRLIRSKGVGVFFITQSPKDIPADVLGQLGTRIQHALRAFTPEDEKALKAASRTYPKSAYYDIPSLLTSVGIGEAVVTLLTSKGVPTPVVHTRMLAPASKMGMATDIAGAATASPLMAKYGERIDNRSAREMLAARLEAPAAAAPTAAAPAQQPAAPAAGQPAPPVIEARVGREAQPGATPKASTRGKKAAQASGGGAELVGDFLKSREGRALVRDVGRGVFGMLVKKSR